MKLLRWAAAGASAYVIYKYSIGKKAVGEDVFDTPERTTGEKAAKPVRTKTVPASAAKSPRAKAPAK